MDYRTITDRRRWNDALLTLPTRHVLQSWDWGEVKRRHGWAPTRLLWKKGGRPVAAAQVLRRPLPRTPLGVMYVPKGPALDYADTRLVTRVFVDLERTMPDVAQDSVTAGAHFVAAAVRVNASSRLNVRSGRLVRSVRVHEEVRPAQMNRGYVKARPVEAGEAGAIISVGDPKEAPVARFLEEGTRHMAAKPFVRPALDEDGPKSLAVAAATTRVQVAAEVKEVRV